MVKRSSGMLGVLLFLILALASCGLFQGRSDEVHVSLTPQSTQVGATTLVVVLENGRGERLDGAAIQIEGSPAGGSGEPSVVYGSGGQDGQYAVPFVWSTSGDWLLTVQVTLPDGRLFIQPFDITVGAAVDG